MTTSKTKLRKLTRGEIVTLSVCAAALVAVLIVAVLVGM